MFPKLEKVAAKAEALISKIDALLPVLPENDWSAVAYRWQRIDVGAFGGARGVLRPVLHPHVIQLNDLYDIDEQKERLIANTKQFVEGKTANNVLLTGARGTGKSSLVKAVLQRFAKQGLRLIEVDRADLIDLPAIAEIVATRHEKFIVFADDLSFEAGDAAYKALKSVLDGGVSAPTENMLVYATSNRRHLMPERMSENAEARHTDDGEIHPGETTEEKISLSERFGLWLSFYPFDQDQYLDIAQHWVEVLSDHAKYDAVAFRKAALLWALERGARSGRIAYQFARDYAGQMTTPSIQKPAAKARTARAKPKASRMAGRTKK
jgi:predicted AAA+ superfamily ATPase